MYWISSRGQPTGGGPPAWGLGAGLTNPHRKTSNLLRNVVESLGPGRILWHDPSRLAQDWDRWRAVVSAVMNLRVLAPRS
jgi:hypothetical protein